MGNHAPSQQQFWPQQSPIRIFKRDTFFAKLPGSYFKWKYKDAPYRGRFDGAGGHANFVLSELSQGQKPPMIWLGHEAARLVKIHLHTPSEHDLEGKDQPGEMHLIHEIESPQSGSTLIVLGIFFEEDKDKPDVDAFKLMSEGCTPADSQDAHGPELEIDPRELMPDTEKWYRYEGSLTSDPYTEIVSWLVFAEPLKVSSADLNLIKEFADQPERKTLPINRRFVLRNFR